MWGRLLLLVSLACGPALLAQAQSSVRIEQASDLIGPDPLQPMGLTPAEQLAATVPAVLSPTGNTVVLSQDGTGNEAFIGQLGIGNRFALVQIGADQRVDALMLGDYNTAAVTQIGALNSYTLLMVADGVDLLPVVQDGVGNQAVQIVAPGLRPAGIEQRGDGMGVTVERSLP